MKRAIVVLYGGGEMTSSVRDAIGTSLHEYGLIDNPDSPIEFYTLTEAEIIQSIVSKTVTVASNESHDENKYERAMSVICKPFMETIKKGDIEGFTIELTNTMQHNLSASPDDPFNVAVKIIAEEGSEAHISSAFMYHHGLSNRVVQIIRRTRDIVCQGRHIIIQ